MEEASIAMEFRPRDYVAERQAHALLRLPADAHPLSSVPASVSQTQSEVRIKEDVDRRFFDPLGVTAGDTAVSGDGLPDLESSCSPGILDETSNQSTKEWTSFRRILMQKFPVKKIISVSSISDLITIAGKGKASTTMHLEEPEDPQIFSDETANSITRQEYVSRMHELKDEITRTWLADDRVTSLKLSTKVARLLMDKSIVQFYPTLFVLATDILDMLGDMVWNRIKRKAEFDEEGMFLRPLPENFSARDVRTDAKETCNNWFCKIGAVRELLPRIYLELAILPCWRFILDQPADSLCRLVTMIRGIADPVAYAYCCLYLTHRAQKLPSSDTGYLVTCINDVRVLLMRILSKVGTTDENATYNNKMLINLMEPSIEYILRCIIKNSSKKHVSNVLLELGLMINQQSLECIPCISIVLHYILKELPADVVSLNAVEILQVIESTTDLSFDQHMNYRLLGFRLYETRPRVEIIKVVVDKIIQVTTLYNTLDEYLKVVDAYMDFIFENQMDEHLNTIVGGISERAGNEHISEGELSSLQSILEKLLSYFNRLEDVLALNHFTDILNMLHGNPRGIISMNILDMATRDVQICDPTIIQFLFEISKSLHDSVDFVNVKDGDSQPACLISRFILMVSYGTDVEHHLAFLTDCRRAFSTMNELKETIVHSCNSLAIKALKSNQMHLNFVKSCIAFSEVTIPSIFSLSRQLNLYLETAEISLLAGLISHSDGLINSAICCLESCGTTAGLRTPDCDKIVSLIRKLCGLLVCIPGDSETGTTHFPNILLNSIKSQSWMTLRMKSQVLCSIILLSTTLTQKKLPYHVDNKKVYGNDVLYHGDTVYKQELVSFCESVLQNLVDAIEQEPSQVARGTVALDACNCIATAFLLSPAVLSICLKLLETAKSCLSIRDKYLLSTIQVLIELSASPAIASLMSA